MSEADTETSALRQRSKLYFHLTSLAMLLIFGVMTIYGIVLVRGVSDAAVLRLLLSWAPGIFYIWALWTLRRFFRELAEGGSGVRVDMTRALSDIGSALMFGAATAVIVTPLINMLAQTTRMGAFPTVNVPALTLGIVGLGLLLIARVLKRALRFEAEAKSLKSVLEGFV